MWNSWTREYIRAFPERYASNTRNKTDRPHVGEVVIIKGEKKNNGKRKLGIVEDLITGRDGLVRAAILPAWKSHLDRPVQHLYPLELSCDRATKVPGKMKLNPDAPTFRQKRDAGVAAETWMREITNDEQEHWIEPKFKVVYEHGITVIIGAQFNVFFCSADKQGSVLEIVRLS